jgi:hypothetical protein
MQCQQNELQQPMIMLKWFCGDSNFIVVNFVFLNNMLGLILNFECSLETWIYFFKNKIVQISLYVILFHLYFGIFCLLGKMLTINCVIYYYFPWFVEHSHNEYFIEFVFFHQVWYLPFIKATWQTILGNIIFITTSLGKNLINVSTINSIWNDRN